MKDFEKGFYDRLCELKNDALDFIYDKVIAEGRSMDFNPPIETYNGNIVRIEIDSAGCYVGIPVKGLNEGKDVVAAIKLIELQNESIIQIASTLNNNDMF